MKNTALYGLAIIATLTAVYIISSPQFEPKMEALGSVGQTLFDADRNQYSVVECSGQVIKAKYNIQVITQAAEYIVAVGSNTQLFLGIARVAADADGEYERLAEVLDLAVMKTSETSQLVALASAACRIKTPAQAAAWQAIYDGLAASAEYPSVEVALAAISAKTPINPIKPISDKGTQPTAAALPIQITDDLQARKVADGIIVFSHAFPWPANSLIVEMENSDLVLVDTPYTPEATGDLLDWVAQQFGPRNITAINTGYHHDNLGGNSYLIEQGIPVHGSSLTARLLADRGDELREMTLNWLKDPAKKRFLDAHKILPYVPPTHLFDIEEGLELEFGHESVQVYYPGPSHSLDNVAVYFPGRKLLFGGCMVIGWNGVGNTSDADLEAWPQSVQKLLQFDCDLVVPGHGKRLDPGLIQHTMELLADYRE